MQAVPESPQSHVCEVLQYLYALEAHLQPPGPTIPPDVQALALWAAAQWRACRPAFPDSVRLYGNAADEYVLTHELGHVFDNREIATDVVDSVTLYTRARPGTYAATAPQEHVAEAFERAVRSMRHGFADSLAVE